MVNATILLGDVRQRLSEIPSGSVQTVITSPPYFGLRDYGTASWDGGDPECDHKVGRATRGGLTQFQQNNKGSFGDEAVWVCPHCGANRIDDQIGLEPSPEEYVEAMVLVFREIRRVLKDDGTLWLNLGDSYWGGKGQSGSGGAEKQAERNERGESLNKSHQTLGGSKQTRPTDGKHPIIKPKDLVGIPWRVAFALQADGWYLRSDIVWAKPNPMPESVTDRPTKSHEYLFLLSKSPKYYYDSEAVKEPVAEATIGRSKRGTSATHKNINGAPGQTKHSLTQAKDNDPDRPVAEKRNRRDVWTINTKPFKGAHFAVMPEALVEPCVLAGSADGDTVLDPFTGSGTVAVVANRLGRNFVGTELNPEYAEIARERITNAIGLLGEVEIRA